MPVDGDPGLVPGGRSLHARRRVAAARLGRRLSCRGRGSFAGRARGAGDAPAPAPAPTAPAPAERVERAGRAAIPRGGGLAALRALGARFAFACVAVARFGFEIAFGLAVRGFALRRRQDAVLGIVFAQPVLRGWPVHGPTDFPDSRPGPAPPLGAYGIPARRVLRCRAAAGLDPAPRLRIRGPLARRIEAALRRRRHATCKGHRASNRPLSPTLRAERVVHPAPLQCAP